MRGVRQHERDTLALANAQLVERRGEAIGQRLARLGMDLLGLWGPLRAGSREARLDGEISHAYLTSLGHTIAGGTAEILRTTVATRGLGLPAAAKGA